ncbi:uncharacterized protein LOC113351714 [Papaver somniferum]|uniref:uncharacterized protein LOC113351714 n=1 Tax=Papaver somniferum TaxID=3469 RepID=UPI000E6FE3E8|nr:uncharacterized protein LOC113351714 [Papaver somniferum]
MGSIGGVVRNHKGDFLLGYSEPIGKTTSTIAEITALQRGLDLVLENGLQNVWFEGDEKRLLEIIANQIPVGPEEIQRRVKLINLILPELNSYKMTHIYREGTCSSGASTGVTAGAGGIGLADGSCAGPMCGGFISL